MEYEIYKITAFDGDGREIVRYLLPNSKNMYKRMMLQEYGNIEEEGMMIADLPPEVREQVEAYNSEVSKLLE